MTCEPIYPSAGCPPQLTPSTTLDPTVYHHYSGRQPLAYTGVQLAFVMGVALIFLGAGFLFTYGLRAWRRPWW